MNPDVRHHRSPTLSPDDLCASSEENCGTGVSPVGSQAGRLCHSLAAAKGRDRKRSTIVLSLIVIGCTLLAYDSNVDGNLDLYHEGERLAHVDAVSDGALPYRDIYVPHGLGEDIIKPALACRWFGTSVEALRRMGQNSYRYRGLLPPLGLAAILLAAVALTRSVTSCALVAAVLVTGLYEVTDRHIFGFLAMAAVAVHIRTAKTRWLWLGGLLAGLACLYSLDVGLYVVAAAGAWAVIRGWNSRPRRAGSRAFTVGRTVLPFLGGLAVVVLPFVVWCAAQGILDDLVRNIHTQIFQREELYPSSYPAPAWNEVASFFDNLRVNAALLLLFYAIPLMYVAAIVLSFMPRLRIKDGHRSRLLLVGLLGLCFWSTVLGRPGFWHLAFAIPPFALLLAVGVRTLKPLIRRRGARTAALVLPCLTILALAWVGQGGIFGKTVLHQESRILPEQLRRAGYPLVASSLPRLGNVRLRPEQAAYLERLVGYIQEHTSPDDTILDLSDQGLLYFLCSRRSPTRFHYVSYCGTAALRQEMADEILSRDRLPMYVIRFTADRPTPDALGEFVTTYYTHEIDIAYATLLRCVNPTAHRKRPSKKATVSRTTDRPERTIMRHRLGSDPSTREALVLATKRQP